MKTRSITMLLTVGLGVTACSADLGPTTTDPGGQTTKEPDDPRIDPRSYFDDYAMDRPSAPTGSGALMVDAEDASVEGMSMPGPLVPAEPGFLDANTFTDYGDSGWLQAATDPSSTFGLDVDTGSFSVARTFVEQGHRPDPDSVRIEEWVNSFDYGDPAPTQGALGLTVDSGISPRGGEGTALVRVGVSTERLAAQDRPQANITFVIDTSGSMNIRERLGLVQSSLALLAVNLRPDDTIAIVIYGSDAAPLLAPTPVAEVDTIIEAIENLVPGGSTNMEAGLRLGYEQARASYDEDAVNVVVLASDGVANGGTTDGDTLTEEITRAGEEGIHLVTVGYGMGNYNDTLMEQLANRGNGFYSYIDTFEEAERLFVEELTPTLYVVAHDTKAQVNFDPEQVERFRLVGYENRLLEHEDFTDDSVDAGELGAGHQVSALYEVQPVGEIRPGQPLGTVSLRWADSSGGAAEQVDVDIAWPQGQAGDSLRLAALVADTAELLKGNSEALNRGYTLADLEAEATELGGRGVVGAQEFGAFLTAAVNASPAE